MAILLMRTACWIPKATNAQSEYVILILHMDHPVGVTFIMCIDISSHTQHKTHCANQTLIYGYRNLTTKLWSVLCVTRNVGTQYVILIALPLQQ
jgi:hypothetical protein